MGVVVRRYIDILTIIINLVSSGSNLWVWLSCIGVVSGCCKEVYRYPHNNY